jgi:release factor glutamine methyltransferase
LRKSATLRAFDAELLMAEALHIDRDKLILAPPPGDAPQRFFDMIGRRKDGEPVAYITGRRAFWNIELHVGPGVLIPRPDSEVLIASALEHFEGSAGPGRILDLGTGPGTLLLAALDLWPNATGVGVDVSRRPCPTPRPTLAARLRIAREAQARRLGEGIAEKFDLILCNPPYVAEDAELGPGVREYRADEALFAGKEGLDAYRSLRPSFHVCSTRAARRVEIGHDQASR